MRPVEFSRSMPKTDHPSNISAASREDLWIERRYPGRRWSWESSCLRWGCHRPRSSLSSLAWLIVGVFPSTTGTTGRHTAPRPKESESLRGRRDKAVIAETGRESRCGREPVSRRWRTVVQAPCLSSHSDGSVQPLEIGIPSKASSTSGSAAPTSFQRISATRRLTPAKRGLKPVRSSGISRSEQRPDNLDEFSSPL